MTLTPDEQDRLAVLEATLQELGGRGVELAEEIDALHHKRDRYVLILRVTVPNESRELVVTDALNETLRALAYEGVIDDSGDDAWGYERDKS